VSFIPSGSRIRLRSNSPRVWPLTTSSSAPSTSVARLYSQQAPGWNASGMAASSLQNSALVRERLEMRACAYWRRTAPPPRNS
jgi:hypothetical protein